MDAPELAGDARLGVLLALRRPQGEVEADEVERRADPRDPGDHVEHPQEDVEDVSQVRVHRSLAIATSSRQPVSSSSSRVVRDPVAEHLEDLGLRAPVDEDDEAEAELLLVDLVQVGEARRARPGRRSSPCSAADRGERPGAARSRDARRGPRPSPSSSSVAITSSACSSGSSTSARRSTRRVRPSKSSLSSSTVSCRGSSRIRTARRGAGCGGGRRRARPRARPA